MAVVSPPVPLSANSSYQLTAPIRPTAGQTWQVRLDNISQYVLVVQVAGKTSYLPPLATNIFLGLGPAEVVVTTGTAIGAVSNPQLYATWAVSPDYVPEAKLLSTGPTSSVPNTQTFGAIGADQSFVVPANVTQLTVDMAAGSGGNTSSVGQQPGSGGKGGRIVFTLAVVAGQTLAFKVGGKGADGGNFHRSPRGTYPNGGAAGDTTTPTNKSAGDGGGRTSILLGATEIATAGAGGGAAFPNNASGDNGGDGGLVATAGGNGTGGSTPEPGGGGPGTSSAGGAGGTAGNAGAAGTAGASLQGGTGASSTANNPGEGGGGGDGHFGGGGGGSAVDFTDGGGGGGGSSFTNPTYCSGVAHSNGYQTGDGYIKVTY